MLSIIIPVYNGSKYLAETLSSIDYRDTDIIVVDDESTDNTVEIAKKFTNKVYTIAHSGPVVARNTGLNHADSEFIMFLDADDILVPNAIQNLLTEIEDNDIIIARRQDFISPDCDKQFKLTTSNYGVLSGCSIIKKAAFDSIGVFDEDLLCGDAYDWILRAEKSNSKIKKIPLISCMRRLHSSNMGICMKDREKEDYCKIIRKHFIKQ